MNNLVKKTVKTKIQYESLLRHIESIRKEISGKSLTELIGLSLSGFQSLLDIYEIAPEKDGFGLPFLIAREILVERDADDVFGQNLFAKMSKSYDRELKQEKIFVDLFVSEARAKENPNLAVSSSVFIIENCLPHCISLWRSALFFSDLRVVNGRDEKVKG